MFKLACRGVLELVFFAALCFHRLCNGLVCAASEIQMQFL